MKINRLEFSIDIKAPKPNIWKALWKDHSYREWAKVFYKGSYVSADNWSEGSTVHFLGPDRTGIYSEILFHTPHKIIQFKHIGTVAKGKEQPIDEETKKWSGTLETYSLMEEKDAATLTIEIDILDKHLDFMKDKLPLAMERIKQLSENL